MACEVGDRERLVIELAWRFEFRDLEAHYYMADRLFCTYGLSGLVWRDLRIAKIEGIEVVVV